MRRIRGILFTICIVISSSLLGTAYFLLFSAESGTLYDSDCKAKMTSELHSYLLENETQVKMASAAMDAIWGEVAGSSKLVLSPYQENYFQVMDLLPSVETVYFKMKRSDVHKFLPVRFFNSHSNNCQSMKYGLQSYDKGRIECTNNLLRYNFRTLSKLQGSVGLLKIDYNLGLFIPWMNKDGTAPVPVKKVNLNEEVTAWFVHVVKDAIVTLRGELFAAKGKVKIGSLGEDMSQIHFETSPKARLAYKELYTIRQFHICEIFHWMIEELPRIMFMWNFLLEHQEVKVHVPCQRSIVVGLLQNLGISKSRMVVGTVSAHYVYVPTSTFKDRGSVIGVNLLARTLQLRMSANITQDTIVLIRRTRKYYFNNHNRIVRMLNDVADGFNMKVAIYSDNPLPTLTYTKTLFHRATAVVAPHGAGLSNLIFSKPGVCVIEGLCYQEGTGRYNLCYNHLSHILGHIYHGYVIKKQCCMNATANELFPLLKRCLYYRRHRLKL